MFDSIPFVFPSLRQPYFLRPSSIIEDKPSIEKEGI